jgi:hypothetical protein
MFAPKTKPWTCITSEVRAGVVEVVKICFKNSGSDNAPNKIFIGVKLSQLHLRLTLVFPLSGGK